MLCNKPAIIRLITLWFVLIFSSDIAKAQNAKQEADSIKIYKNIESYSKRSKITKFIYRLFFKPLSTTPPSTQVRKKVYKKLIQKPYRLYEGKIIRRIDIETLDPFGQNLADTVQIRQTFLPRAGNRLHIKTQRITIRNLLLIRPGQRFDSLRVKESERLVRSQGYVRDVLFWVKSPSKNSDSVDIYIRVLDKWSITPAFAASPAKVVVQLSEKNFSGIGHEFKNKYSWYHTTGDDAFSASYYIPNIHNTYINSTFQYGTDEYRNFIKSFSIDRPFFSSYAKWAAGVNFSQQLNKSVIYTPDSFQLLQNYKFNSQDYWAGNSIQVFRGRSEQNRATQFISALRYARKRFLQKPDASIDTLYEYDDENLYLAGIGISTRKYVQDRFIFDYGVTEDVPIGKVYALTGGYQEKFNTGRIYAGAQISAGNYYRWGYLSTSLEYGSFYRNGHNEQGIVSASVIYFTGLAETARWKFRVFLKPRVIIGINRFIKDSLTLNDGYGIDGFNSSTLGGTTRFIFTLQTQSYAPWNILGFRFGPYLIYSAGLLGSESTGFRNSRLYSQFGLGVLIKNENLVFSSLQLSVSFYPVIPPNGDNVFKINSFKSTDFGLRDFTIGKPGVVRFE